MAKKDMERLERAAARGDAAARGRLEREVAAGRRAYDLDVRVGAKHAKALISGLPPLEPWRQGEMALWPKAKSKNRSVVSIPLPFGIVRPEIGFIRPNEPRDELKILASWKAWRPSQSTSSTERRPGRQNYFDGAISVWFEDAYQLMIAPRTASHGQAKIVLNAGWNAVLVAHAIDAVYRRGATACKVLMDIADKLREGDKAGLEEIVRSLSSNKDGQDRVRRRIKQIGGAVDEAKRMNARMGQEA